MIELIKYNTIDYLKSIGLRNKILREPLGLKLSGNQISKEGNIDFYHIAYKVDSDILGVLVLKKLNNKFQVFQIVVKEQHQKLGIGQLLMEKAETIVRENDLEEIIVFSREESIGFYKKMGFKSTKKEFIIVGLNHVKMIKKLKKKKASAEQSV